MKKVLLLMFALICFSATATAQSCKISGANDGSTIMVTNDYQDGSQIVVNLENDSERTCANVTVEVEVSYYHARNQIFTGSDKSCPNATCVIKVEIGNINDMKGYKVKKVSGTKCDSL
jgi:hypothetical protein